VPNEIWILDTSVVASWFFSDEVHHRLSLTVRARVHEHPSLFVVPPLFYSELVHVLARKSKRDEPFVHAAMHLVLRLGLRTLPLSERALGRMPHWTCSIGLSGYDATLVALAEDLGGKWVTVDAKAAKKAGSRVARGP
jgi:predicted nucleic acid-binding protein